MTHDSSAAPIGDTPDLLPEKVQSENIWRLSIAQALAGANAVVVYATGAIVGDQLAPSPMLAIARSRWSTKGTGSFIPCAIASKSVIWAP